MHRVVRLAPMGVHPAVPDVHNPGRLGVDDPQLGGQTLHRQLHHCPVPVVVVVGAEELQAVH